MNEHGEIRVGGEMMDFPAVMALLSQTYWAKGRSAEVVRRSMENSICSAFFSLIGRSALPVC